MKHLKAGLILALLACAGILTMGCEGPEKNTDDDDVTVTFDANGGSPNPNPIVIPKNSSMGDYYPADPGLDGYIFDGWFNGGTHYDRDTHINRNITLTAEWTDISNAIAVAFTSLTADGSASAATTTLTLTFDKDITGLSAGDIELTAGSTGAIKGGLTKGSETGVYTLAVSNITASAEVTVKVGKHGYNVTDALQTVAVFRDPSTEGPDLEPVTFNTLTANGSSAATTTTLTLTFDKDITGLSATDITLTGGATRGALNRTGTGVYTLEVTGITAGGSVTVTVAKTGFNIIGSTKIVTVFYYSAPTYAFTGVTPNGSTAAATTQLTLTFSTAVPGLATGDITLSGSTGATRGALSGSGPTYTLTVSNVTASGSLTVAVARSGLTITGSPKTVTVFPTPSKITTDFSGINKTTNSTMTPRPTYQGKDNVTEVKAPPNTTGGNYAILTYDLGAYAGKTITITLSMEVWLANSAKAVWQINIDPGYPEVAGTFTDLAAGTWLNLNGNRTFSNLPAGRSLYLSTGQLGADNTIYIADFTMTITIDDGTGGGGGGGGSGSGGAVWTTDKAVKITIGAREDLYGKIKAFDPAGKSLTWTSNAPAVANVNSNGIVTALSYTTGGNSIVSSEATGTATITVTQTGTANTDTFTVTTTMESLVDLIDLTPLKDLFASHFKIGNITRGYYTSLDYSSTITNKWLNRHFNVLTAENVMKPDKYSNGRNASTGAITYTWEAPDNFVNAATASNFDILAHVLLWHRQIPTWQVNMATASKDTALAAMKSFITAVVTRYKGKIWAWDVLNEIFPDSVTASSDWTTSMRGDGTNIANNQEPNPWFMSIGSDFVYEGFLAARLADPAAKLYYNDYNLDNVGKATMVRNMVQAVNAKYATAYPNAGRKLIEGIGMQSHHNTNVTVAHIRATLELFKPLGVSISISELDLLCGPYSNTLEGTDKPPAASVTNERKLEAANLYHEYFKLFIEYSNIIERVTFWGLYDRGSWRSPGLPLPFEGVPNDSTNPGGLMAKPAYYRILAALPN
jgi:uncharacterized repeat protein (TIGR02543 family)